MRLQLNSTVKVKPAEEIMVGFLAASVVESDCWKEEVANMCMVASSQTGDGITAEQYKAYKALSEAEFKEKNGLKQMPSKYRSTKSVIVNALKNNVELLDDDGFPRGKTEVEKDIRLVTNKAFTGVIVPMAMELEGPAFSKKMTEYEKCYYAAEYIKRHWPDVGAVGQDVIKKLLEGIV